MGNPLFDRKPIRETIAWKVSSRGIPRVTKSMQQRIENRARDPSLYRSFPEMEEIADQIAISQKIHDPENAHLFTAEAAQKAFKDVEL